MKGTALPPAWLPDCTIRHGEDVESHGRWTSTFENPAFVRRMPPRSRTVLVTRGCSPSVLIMQLQQQRALTTLELQSLTTHMSHRHMSVCVIMSCRPRWVLSFCRVFLSLQ